MGQSVPQETADRVARLRAQGRACAGPVRSRLGCTSRATWRVTTESWPHRIGEGARAEHALPMCLRHARLYPVGLEGKNFRVLSASRL